MNSKFRQSQVPLDENLATNYFLKIFLLNIQTIHELPLDSWISFSQRKKWSRLPIVAERIKTGQSTMCMIFSMLSAIPGSLTV
ncbi:hypothetical protein BpHYR1_002207 [Brachionus plicatilis]|uniref:Uncharacterized protein n=1 Tax=Brachionus plicatilis TaxID=10195 RepID=A0A3M7R1N8_BRAPC|nr:hypothetical protein BpHYR1_002207 [Brachionus plicatilis]